MSCFLCRQIVILKPEVMINVKCLFGYEDQAQLQDVKQGADKNDLRRLFSNLYEVNRGIILQYKAQFGDTEAWINMEDDFKIKDDFTQLRIIKSPLYKLNLGNLSPVTSVVFCCDMQERFRPAIKFFNEIVKVASRVLKASEILKIPLVVTEQYPRGLGKTVSDLDISHASVVAEKTKFSMLTPEVEDQLDKLPHVSSVILLGVETHVCVQQTTLDLLARGFEVHVLADATGSRSLTDRHVAYERLRRAGAIITTCETVLLQFVGDKNHEHFKAIQNLIKDLPPDTGLQVKSSI
ncbi:isochorismatase domain-containing protein 2-like [Clavelina lepadiformis]|uniref:isochorismatase domain-containing protein 2-like n=1 Tax=Clavelina lepadiformis TaxID=159417 RepID=UPI004042D3D0